MLMITILMGCIIIFIYWCSVQNYCAFKIQIFCHGLTRNDLPSKVISMFWDIKVTCFLGHFTVK